METVTWDVAGTDTRRPGAEREDQPVHRRRADLPDGAGRLHAQRRVADGAAAQRHHHHRADQGRGGRQLLLRRQRRQLLHRRPSTGARRPGQGQVRQPAGLEHEARDRQGQGEVRVPSASPARSPSGSATFTFKKGKIAFAGDIVKSSKIKGHKVKFEGDRHQQGQGRLHPGHRRAGQGLEGQDPGPAAEASGWSTTRCPGKKPSAKPRTKVKGHVTITVSSGWQARAPVRRTLASRRPLLGHLDRRAAAAARRPVAAVDPHPLALAQVAGGRLDRALLVEHPASAGRGGPAGAGRAPPRPGSRGRTPRVKQSSAAYIVADAGQVALVEERVAQRPVGLAGQVGQRDLLVPVGAEQVGAEVADRRRSSSARSSSSTMPSEKPIATAEPVSRTTRAVVRRARPALAGPDRPSSCPPS